jgi:sterol desaturase/sphingolipid hydroxylase (fatty acid hydroxylase superfamily)
MLSRLSPSTPLYVTAAIVFAVIALRYVLFAGGAFLFFHRSARYANSPRRLARPADAKQVERELLSSLSTVAVFTAMGLVIAHARRVGLTPVAPEWLRAHPALWFFGSLALMLFVHDLYFYWAHRLMHTKWLYERVHLVHHKSNNPSPLSAFAFHPSEAVLEALPVFVLLLTVPVTPWAILVFQMLSLAINVYGHLGVELTPRWWLDRWPGKVFNTTTHHHMHHRSNKYNFGLYLNVWDRLFGTNHPEYAAKFRAVTERDALPERGALSVSHETASSDGAAAT